MYKTQSTSPEAAFQSVLLDASTHKPEIIIGSTHKEQLIWTLTNNQDKELKITPFKDKNASKNHYHFLFSFSPGSLAAEPTLPDWKTVVEKDSKGTITKLYLALDGNKALTIGSEKNHQLKLTYTKAIRKDSNNSKMGVTITAGANVTLGKKSIEGTSLGPIDLRLVKASVAAQSTLPISVDFVGRRTVLNDGVTPNSFTFAITNLMQTDLNLNAQGNSERPPAAFTLWFDAAPNQPCKPYSWALARIQDLVSEDVKIKMPSDNWHYRLPSLGAKSEVTPGNPRWDIILKKSVPLKPQDPVLFTFSGIKTDLDPGFTRMYLRYENLPGFHDGILISELEKTPMLYGSKNGDGVYISGGHYEGDTPPSEPQYESVLNVRPFGDKSAATFYPGKGVNDGELELTSSNHGWSFNIKADAEEKKHFGIGTTDPGAMLDIGRGENKENSVSLQLRNGNNSDKFERTQITFSWNGIQEYCHAIKSRHNANGNKDNALDFYVWGHGSDKSAIGGLHTMTLNAGNVGIGTTNPNERLEIAEPNGGRAIISDGKGDNRRAILIQAPAEKKDYGRIAAYKYGDSKDEGGKDLVLQDTGGNVGIGTTKPEEKLDVNGTIKAKATKVAGQLEVMGSLGIGTKEPNEKLEIAGSEGKGGRAIVSDGKGKKRRAVLIEAPGKDKDYGRILAYKYGDGKVGKNLVLQDSGGNVGIGTTDPKERLEIAGNVKVKNDLIVEGTTYCKGPLKYYWSPDNAWKHINNRAGNWAGSSTTSGPSDMRLKKDVNPIKNALIKVSQLNGMFYRWNNKGLDYFGKDIESTISAGPGATKAEHEEVWQAEREKLHKKLSKTHAGVIAQEVESVLPEAVTEDEEGYKSVQYHSLIPLLIEAIKEQSDMADNQQKEIERLRSDRKKSDQMRAELETVKAKVSKLETAIRDLLMDRETNSSNG